MADKPFWQVTALDDMTEEQWESLCDGCGKCCVYKLEGDEGEFYQTDVSCQYFDQQSCRCSQYTNRFTLVPDCIQVTPDAARSFDWLPNTCAYKLLAKGQDLPQWHPLVSGNSESVHLANRSARGKVISEKKASELEEHIIAILIPEDDEADPLSEIEPDPVD